jgi:hypothetical protein
MAVITKDKLADDDALQVPLTLAANFQKLYDQLQQLIEMFSKFDTTVKDNSLPKVKGDTDDLTQAQAELIKIQNQIAVQAARNNDAYREQQSILADLKAEMKNNQALQDTTKQFDAQYASLTELEKALKSNQIAWSNLRGEEQRKSQQGQELKSTIDKQYASVQELRKEINLHVQETKNWREQLEGALPALRQVAPEATEGGEALASMGKNMGALLTSPVALGIAAVAGAFEFLKVSVDSYVEDTIDGTDKAEQAMNVFSAVTYSARLMMRDLGNSIVDTFSSDTWSGLVQGFLTYISPTWGAMYGVVKEQKDKITALEQEIKKEQILEMTEVAEKQNELSELMFNARDKIHQTAEERYQDVQKYKQVLKEQIDIQLDANEKERQAVLQEIQLSGYKTTLATTSADILEDENAKTKVNYDLVQRLAELEKARLDIQRQATDGARRRQQLEDTLLKEEETRQLTQSEQADAARRQKYQNEQQEDLDNSKQILNNQQYTFDQQLQAQSEFVAASKGLDDVKMFQELDALKKESLARIELDKNTLDQITHTQGLSLTEQAALIIQAKEAQLQNDKTYNSQRDAILDQHIENQKQIVLKGINDTGKLYETYYKNLTAEEDILNAGAAKRLEEQFANGEITYTEYIGKKKLADTQYKEAQQETLLQQLKQEIEYYDSLKTLTAEQEQTLINLRKQYAQLDLENERTKNAEKLRIDQEYKQKAVQLEQTLFASVTTVTNGILDAQTQSLQNQLSAQQAAEQTALTEAGNNANAKSAITQRYAKIEAQTQKEIAEEQTKKAIFDKAISAAQVIVKTALAVAEQLPGLPFTAPLITLIEAIGAVELGAIVATPIPKYAKGTKYAKQGWSMVNDGGGPELIQEPSGQMHLYDVPGAVLTYLKEGSKVFTAEETAKMRIDGIKSSLRKGVETVSVSTVIDLSPINKQFAELNKTIKNKRMGVNVIIQKEDGFTTMVQRRYR